MRASNGGCELNNCIRPRRPPAMPSARSSRGNWAFDCYAIRRSSAAIIFCRPAKEAPPASARNSRWRLNPITTTDARNPRTTSAMMVVIQNAGPFPCSVLKTSLSTRLPMTRDNNNTNVLTTPGLGQASPYHRWPHGSLHGPVPPRLPLPSSCKVTRSDGHQRISVRHNGCKRSQLT